LQVSCKEFKDYVKLLISKYKQVKKEIKVDYEENPELFLGVFPVSYRLFSTLIFAVLPPIIAGFYEIAIRRTK
jgi:hypothetical protein